MSDRTIINSLWLGKKSVSWSIRAQELRASLRATRAPFLPVTPTDPRDPQAFSKGRNKKREREENQTKHKRIETLGFSLPLLLAQHPLRKKEPPRVLKQEPHWRARAERRAGAHSGRHLRAGQRALKSTPSSSSTRRERKGNADPFKGSIIK